MGQRAGRNVACEKEALCSQDLEHCSAEGARPQFFTVPLCSFQLVDNWDSGRMSTARQGEMGRTRAEKGSKEGPGEREGHYRKSVLSTHLWTSLCRGNYFGKAFYVLIPSPRADRPTVT